MEGTTPFSALSREAGSSNSGMLPGLPPICPKSCLKSLICVKTSSKIKKSFVH
jgi:hypothetical protein